MGPRTAKAPQGANTTVMRWNAGKKSIAKTYAISRAVPESICSFAALVMLGPFLHSHISLLEQSRFGLDIPLATQALRHRRLAIMPRPLGPLLSPSTVPLSSTLLSLLLPCPRLSLVHPAPPRTPLCLLPPHLSLRLLSLLFPLHPSLPPLSLLLLRPPTPPRARTTLHNLALALPPPRLTMLLRYVAVPACATYTHN